MESLIQKDKECFFCKTTLDLHKHHVIHGTANRKLSDKHGCWIWLCATHHNMSSDSVHMNHNMDMVVKKITQEKFEREYGHDKWMAVFGKNYI